MKMEDIDFVVTWVDSSDPNWIAKRNKYAPKSSQLNGDDRYRDYGTFKYWFRSVEKYAPWVHRIYLITDAQVPNWLNINSEKLIVIDHTDFINKKFLPTFNSNAIELSIGNISGLSEHFVLFNDDCFLNAPLSPTDFFKDGLPKDVGVFMPIYPREEFDHIIVNNLIPINQNFIKHSVLKKNFLKYFNFKYGRGLLSNILDFSYPRVTGIYNPHLPTSYRKSEYISILKQNKSLQEATISHRFRTNDDISHWLVRYWRIMQGEFSPQSINFGKRYKLSEYKEVLNDIKTSKHQYICINDEQIDDFDKITKQIDICFAEKFSNKSSFEK